MSAAVTPARALAYEILRRTFEDGAWTDRAFTAGASRAALDGRELAQTRPMTRLPQVLENVAVADREAIDGAAELWDAVERENGALEGRGRVLVRPSGTESLVRVMVEAPEQAEAEAVCARLVEIVQAELT